MEGILASILQLFGLVMFKLYGWVVVVAILGYLIWQNRRREQWVANTEHMLLQIEVPRENDKKELSAEQLFASLHGILRPKSELLKEGALQEHISFEIAAKENRIHFYVWVPVHLKDFVEGQIYAQYPNVRIFEGVQDYARTELSERTAYTTELKLNGNEAMPIRTFDSFEVDPLAGITAVMAKLDHPGEEMWLQVLARPIEDDWKDKSKAYADEVKDGKPKPFSGELTKQLIEVPAYVITHFFSALFAPPEAPKKDDKKKDDKEVPTGKKAVIKAVEEKATKLGYQVKIRATYIGTDDTLARSRKQALLAAFKQYNTLNLNGFKAGSTSEGEDGLAEYRARLFADDGYTLNIEELASVYHLPHASVETPNMAWTSVKTSEPPANLPTAAGSNPADISLFGLTNFRGKQEKFGIKRRDRGRHLYIIGQTGTGKSKLLNLLTLSDIYHDQGFAIIDPHGDFAVDMLQFIPEHRLKDVIYFNPTDRDFPIAFNPLEVTDPIMKNNISSEMIGVLKRMFDSWGPRLEYILRYTILALLDYPDSTLLGITRMLTEKEFRKKVIREIQDPVVKNFWVNEFASWNDKFANEAVAPVLNKVGAFTANPLIRNIIGQPKSGMDLRKIMDEGKILIVNLSRGQIGEDNAAILGAMMVTKIQLAAMGRANVPLEQRRPFYLYVDEFQNFATDSFAVILSEARKYGLNLTVANQYVSQMPQEVRDAVFGNVGSMVSFRVGPEDSNILARNFEPVFEASDLVKLNNQHIVISMSVDGEKAIPFSATTLRFPEPEQDITDRIVEMTRAKYASHRTEVEKSIEEWSGARIDRPGEGENAPTETEQKPNSENSFLGGLKNPTPPRTGARSDHNQGQGRSGNSNSHRRTHDGHRRDERRGGGNNRSHSGSSSQGRRHDDRQPERKPVGAPVGGGGPQELAPGQSTHLK